MANVWRKDDNVKEQPKRNIMDLSFQNNLTTQFGKLVPVFCKEFIPGDSFSIKPTFSLKFQPMVFPIQTRMRAHLHFFKVRNRNLWKDWEDFIAKNKENLDPPYLDTSVTKPTTGSLLDYLGVPTTLVGNYGFVSSEKFYPIQRDSFYLIDVSKDSAFATVADAYEGCSSCFPGIVNYDNLDSVIGSSFESVLSDYNSDMSFVDVANSPSQVTRFEVDLSNSVGNNLRIQLDATGLLSYFTSADDSVIVNTIDEFLTGYFVPETKSSYPIARPWTPETYQYSNFISNCFCFVCDETGVIKYVSKFPSLANQGEIEFNIPDLQSYGSSIIYITLPVFAKGYYTSGVSSASFRLRYGSSDGHVFASSLTYSVGSSSVIDIDDETSPYWRSGATIDLRERIKLSALPCRAYEQIYNSFYRNAENNPYILNGVPEYNKYMPTDEGGVDANLYDFYYRNWEDDFLTTALQQPQAGIAPLVGLTGTAGTATVTLADEDGNTSEATASYDEEGNVTSVAFANNTSLTQALADAVQYGISINDLRNVNAFQRWLEAKARGGYKYRDVIETMFGITVRYDTLDMPEFIGGTSIDIMVNQISQTVPTETSPLGDYAGQAAGIGTGQTINEYFDEHGFIIGILSVVPVPNYSQLLPKHFIKRDAFDFYFPQFGHIGMQPIKYDEVCPVQAYQDSTEQNNVLDETFGYQRAWYDYLASTDEVHGEFRTNLRNFVMNRTFDVKPELVNEFLTVDPSQLNDVFAIEDDSYDKILGQIYFDVKAKRPIPLYGIPKLE